MATKQQTVRLLTPVFRLSWPSLYVPTAQNEDQAPKYSCQAIFKPDEFSTKEKELWAKIKAEIDKVSKERLGVPANKLGSEHYPIKSGIGKGWNGHVEGTVYARLSTHFKPGVVDRDRTPLVPKATATGELVMPDEVYPGVYARAVINFWVYDGTRKSDGKKHGQKGVGLGLQNIQIVRDGERLDGRVAPEDDFEDDLPEVEGDDFKDPLSGSSDGIEDDIPF